MPVAVVKQQQTSNLEEKRGGCEAAWEVDDAGKEVGKVQASPTGRQGRTAPRDEKRRERKTGREGCRGSTRVEKSAASTSNMKD